MKINKLIISLSVISLIGTAFMYRLLPQEIALHFNYLGEVDNWGNKNYIWLFAALPFLIYFLMYIIPKIDPRKDSYEKHSRAYSVLANTVSLFMIALNWITILYSLEYVVNIQIFILMSIGILWIVIGNYLPNARQNYTFGIRTPWTLNSEEVWTKTHRVGGVGFVITGFIAIAAAFLPGLAAIILFGISTGILFIGLFLYSYVMFKKSIS